MRSALVVAFALAIVLPLDQLEGKGMGFRAPLFGLSMVVVPLASRRRLTPAANTADVLVVAPFLLVSAFHAWRFRRVDDDRDARLIGAGVGALAIVAWEIAEWAVAESGAGGGLALTYGDTIGDLALSTGGGIVASFVAVALFGHGFEPTAASIDT